MLLHVLFFILFDHAIIYLYDHAPYVHHFMYVCIYVIL